MGIFRRIFGARKSAPGSSQPDKDRRRWSFGRSSNTIPSSVPDRRSGPLDDNLDANKHAIAVAAATAAVAEAALAAAQAAAEVVRLTSGSVGRSAAVSTVSGHVSESHCRWHEEVAAVKIQSAFRGYLARRALRALKALVKLQALVRGHIVRKQTADMLRRMQTLVRVQARARAGRYHVSESWHSTASKSSLSHDTKCGSNSKFGDVNAVHLDEAKLGSNWLEHWMEESFQNDHGSMAMRNRHAYDERSDKILEVDTWKPHMKSRQGVGTFQTWQHVMASEYNQNFTTYDTPSKSSRKAIHHKPTASACEALSMNSLRYPVGKDEAVSRTVGSNSPHVLSPSSRPGSGSKRGTFTPTRSECSWGYPGYPNYMANTECFRAKVRSQSAPRQRLEFENYGSSKRGVYEADMISEKGFVQQSNNRSKAFPASGRLNNRPSSTHLR